MYFSGTGFLEKLKKPLIYSSNIAVINMNNQPSKEMFKNFIFFKESCIIEFYYLR